ncbi:MAG: CerR family C-terminal domain-containing protein [Desulfosudaceae bacterium]
MTSPTDNTRERILDQAERLFAVKGFETVTIREITGAARSNLAAVNYYFGSKQQLYLTVFRERWLRRSRRVNEYFLRQLTDKSRPGISEVVEALARVFLEGPLDDEERRCHAQLMQQELASPGPALAMVLEEVIQPYQRQLADLIRPHLPPGTDEERLRLCLLGILGMTLYFAFARPAVTMVTGREYTPQFKKRLIKHITGFAVSGLNFLEAEQ